MYTRSGDEERDGRAQGGGARGRARLQSGPERGHPHRGGERGGQGARRRQALIRRSCSSSLLRLLAPSGSARQDRIERPQRKQGRTNDDSPTAQRKGTEEPEQGRARQRGGEQATRAHRPSDASATEAGRRTKHEETRGIKD